MVNSESKSKEVPDKWITQAQINLIVELYEETNYSRRYCIEELQDISRELANKHIQMLKDLKSRQYQDRKNHESGVVFDKIGYGMNYKLFAPSVRMDIFKRNVVEFGFNAAIDMEYACYKKAQEHSRQAVKDSGLK